jgi:hypothetical protein
MTQPLNMGKLRGSPIPGVRRLTLPEEEKIDRERVIAAGFTADEVDCWQLTARVADMLMELPKLNEMDAARFPQLLQHDHGITILCFFTTSCFC